MKSLEDLKGYKIRYNDGDDDLTARYGSIVDFISKDNFFYALIFTGKKFIMVDITKLELTDEKVFIIKDVE